MVDAGSFGSGDGKRYFLLQALDPDQDYPVLEARFQADDLTVLRSILGSDAEADPDLRHGYRLIKPQLQAIGEAFGTALDAGDRPVGLIAIHSIRMAPYLIHTGFELPLMLEGRKPFAKFSDLYPDPNGWLSDLMERFAPWIATGAITCRVIDEPWPKPHRTRDGQQMLGVRQVFYTLPGEEWRVDAHQLVYEVSLKTGWNDTLERMEGRLLGYEAWQIDWWIGRGVLAHQRKQKAAG